MCKHINKLVLKKIVNEKNSIFIFIIPILYRMSELNELIYKTSKDWMWMICYSYLKETYMCLTV